MPAKSSSASTRPVASTPRPSLLASIVAAPFMALLFILGLITLTPGQSRAVTVDVYDPGQASQKPAAAASSNTPGQHGSQGGGAGKDGDPNPAAVQIEVSGVNDPLNASLPSTVSAQSGANGAAGGNNDNAIVAGGRGGHGGAAPGYQVEFRSTVVTFDGHMGFSAGNGGQGGSGGLNDGGIAGAGVGGIGGKGGSLSLLFDGDVIASPASGAFSLASGSGGLKGADNLANGGAGGAGGAVSATINGSLTAIKDMNFNFTLGAANYGGKGALSLAVKKNLEIAAGKTVTMSVTGANMSSGADSINFNTLLLNPGAAFNAGAAALNTTSANYFYSLSNLDVINNAAWTTAGTYAPNGHASAVRLDLTGVAPNQTVLTFGGAGVVDLTSFDPKAQHDAYLTALKSANLHHLADNPGYRAAAGRPAFIASAYENKPFDLGTRTIIDKTASSFSPATTQVELRADGNYHFISGGSALSATEGDLFDDFAFTAGLRRYYWDVYVLNSGDKPLLARNYHTADASKVYTQAAAAASLSLIQTFQNTLEAFGKISHHPGALNRVNVSASVAGSEARAETGSHVKVYNLSAAMTASYSANLGPAVLTFGVFGELGRGNYDTFALVPRYGEVFGDGEAKTAGGGAFFKSAFSNGTFIELSARRGTVDNEFKLAKDPWTPRPERYSYHSKKDYLGAHAGLGHVFKLGEGTSLSAYGRYFWTRADGVTFKSKNGDAITLGDVESNRVRGGARLTRTTADGMAAFYVGAAVERELDGEVFGSFNGHSIPNPAKTSGVSGFGEFGFKLSPARNGAFSINADVFGWVGQMKGAGGSLSMNFSF